MVNSFEIWEKAPLDAFHWERLPSGKCIWHCKSANGKSRTVKAPDMPIKETSLWRDAAKQKEADTIKLKLKQELEDRNIVLAH